MHSGRIIEFDVQIKIWREVFKKYMQYSFLEGHMVLTLLKLFIDGSRFFFWSKGWVWYAK